ncbi:armadillo-type protein [Mucor lusitanicus]|uniref:Armadillo-type protein n=1 Tax=Mucor circinelloides f. lusitanicus TaxID=29924 RepID=A0A8H4BHE2_MUCCL|nr:armadillo-type protein [Mucor lusitanicus]
MDQNAVYQLFVSTYHPDPNVHKQAELNIRNFESQAGFLPLVLQIQASEELELGARQAAAIYFKNCMHKHWSRSTKGLAEQDKVVIKKSILHALLTAPAAVQVQLAASLNSILSSDFPDQWPDFINELEAFLTSDDIRAVHVGLVALREVVKVYQWKAMERREPLQQIIKLTFPSIQEICNKLLQLDTAEAGDMLKLALKIYHSSIHVDLPKCLQEHTALVGWCTIFLQLVDKKIPNEIQPADLEEREKFGWWKTKKWAYHCLNRLFGKYGNPAILPPSLTKYASFAKSFVTNFAPNILQTYLQQVDGWIKKEHWMSNRCLALSAAFFDDSIKHKITWQIIKPHTDTLVAQFLFPQLCFSKEDEQLWTEDAVDYAHKKMDPLEDTSSKQHNAIMLLIDLAKNRYKHTFMSTLGFIHGVLNNYMETPEDQKNGRDKDGALCMIGALAPLIVGSSTEVEEMMEPFFVTHVFPEFKSRFPYLRARACDTARHFNELDFSNEQNLAILYQNVLDCLRDPELPVRVQAALALQPMTRHESICEAMGPNLPLIMQELLNLTNEIDIDTLATVMQNFVEVFASHLAPFAVQLCTQLRDTFLRIMEELAQVSISNTHEEDDATANEKGEKTMAAMGVLKTIGTLILSLENTPDILQQLENALLPVITYTLEHRVFDLYDEVFEIVDSCTFASKTVTPTMWGVFELIYGSFKESGCRYMQEMLPCLDNFIAYGKDVFISNDQVKQMLFDMIEWVMKSEDMDEKDRVCACKLMEAVLLHCRGSVDMFVSPFLNLVFHYIFTGQMKTTEFKVHCIEVVLNCLYYNTEVTLHILEQNQWSQGFFTLWFSCLDKFSRVHDKKLAIVTLCSLLALPADKIPVSLQSGWPQILTSVSLVFESLPDAIENRQHLETIYQGTYEDEEDEDDEEEDEEDEDTADVEEDTDGIEQEVEEEEVEEEEDDEDEEDEEEDEDEDEDGDVQDEDAEYLEFLANQKIEEHGEDTEDEIEEEILYQSPLDEIDPYECFEQVFRDMQQNKPDLYAHITKDLTVDHQNNIMSILSQAEQQRNELSTV